MASISLRTPFEHISAFVVGQRSLLECVYSFNALSAEVFHEHWFGKRSFVLEGTCDLSSTIFSEPKDLSCPPSFEFLIILGSTDQEENMIFTSTDIEYPSISEHAKHWIDKVQCGFLPITNSVPPWSLGCCTPFQYG